MSETEEEIKEAYLDQDSVKMSRKIREAMLVIVLDDSSEKDLNLYKHIMKNFSKGELAHIAAVYTVKKLLEELDNNHETVALVKGIKMLDKLGKMGGENNPEK